MCKELYQMNELIESHVGLVPFMIAKHFGCPDQHVKDELVSIGYEALVLAARKYNPEIAQFSTFASIKIRGAILNHFRKEKRRSQIARPFSIDKAATEDGAEWHELLADDSAEYEDLVITEVMAQEALSCLQGEELEVVMSFYGIDTGCPTSLPKIAKAVGLSPSTTFKRKKSAMEKMRKELCVG